MLQLKNIKKQYKTGNLTQDALNDVSLNLRDNEFVAILGPSGSGKTTLLNIIGGLDRYDSGDLIINDVSTKQYKDRDWDSYRNHTIGFVFQSYNLIPHQTILSNVELALTISGIGLSERRQRAKEALERVGLSEHMHKKPNQLSGGQMQRVAIARALVNNPDILLADEPTGALDSDTSVQVMELLKEVAKDRLVVMVTHNPELAEQYATRIVKVKDGKIISDSQPFKLKKNKKATHKNLGKSSMSFFTSLALSFNNLRSKFTRTMLVALAGSIGIIGIALIMALSNGVNDFIQRTEEETLKQYPLTVTGMSINLEDIMEAVNSRNKGSSHSSDSDKIKEVEVLKGLFSTFKTNDLSSLKEWLEKDDGNIAEYINYIEYGYNLKPRIYIEDEGDYRQVNPDPIMNAFGYTSQMDNFSTMFTSSMRTGMDTFNVMPSNEDLYKNSYEVLSGRWPTKYNECVVVLTADNTIPDLVLYALNLKNSDGLNLLISKFMAGDNIEISSERGEYKYSDFIGKKFKVVNIAESYVYDETRKVWYSRSSDQTFINNLCEKSEDLTIVGIMRPLPDADYASLAIGINFPIDLIYHCIDEAEKYEIVQQQLANPDTDVLTGKPFGSATKTMMDMKDLFSVDEEALKNAFGFNMEDMDIDLEGQMSNIDFSDVGQNIDLSGLDISMPQLNMNALLSGIKINFSAESMGNMFKKLLEAYQKYYSSDPSINWENLPNAFSEYFQTEETQQLLEDEIRNIISKVGEEAITDADLTAFALEIISGYEAWAEENGITESNNETISEYLQTDEAKQIIRNGVQNLIAKLSSAAIPEEMLKEFAQTLIEHYDAYALENGQPVLSKLQESFDEFINSPEAQKIIMEEVEKSIDTSELKRRLNNAMNEFGTELQTSLEKAMMTVMQSVLNEIAEKLKKEMPEVFESVMQQMQDSFQFDENSFAEALGIDFSAEELMELMTSLLSNEVSTYKGNLQNFGYVPKNSPNTINIYPKDFTAKSKIKDAIDERNEILKEAGEYEKTASYTDFVGLLMSSVTDIINAISYILIAFVSISLVVSSIMIGVITYISVLERKKEIGILRAIGASKKNISQIFNAETLIIGALAGTFGVIISVLLLIPTNIIVSNVTGQDVHAFLPVESALLLIGLSTILTMIGGLIPSFKASRQDPVIALRTE